jgi:hypothetical protein
MVDWRIIANGRDGMLAMLHAIRSLTGHTVRVRVVDGMDDLYAVGYVHEAGKDKSAQNIPQQTETGTLTIVCQRPELLSTRASQVQLMPVSRVRGGMSFGVPDYVKSWTGTVNASASTLSQDGAVVATNLFTSPKPTSNLTISNNLRVVASFPSGGMLLNQTSEVLTAYGAFVQIPLPALTSGVTYHVEADMLPSASVKPPTLLERKMLMVANRSRMTLVSGDNTVGSGRRACTFTADGVTSYDLVLFAGDGSGDTSMSVLWKNIIIVSDSDWQAMQALGIYWFDGDSQSPQPNAGLSYGPDGRGLSYGVSAGGERNLAVLSNHGTTNAYPTITVTGPFPNGVEIQTGVGGVIRYTGAIGMVPLTIQCDPRNVSASMGGVDVGRYLTGRDLPAIPAGGSVSLRLMSAGSGWVTVTTRDAYL